MQGTRVRSLVWEDSTCCRATKPVHRNYWACALEPGSPDYGAQVPRARAPQQEKPLQGEACGPQLEKHHTQQQRPRAAKNKNPK